MSIASVPVEKLHERFGWKTPFVLPAESREKPLAAWNMELDDAPILRYVYRNLRPKRHLEFGTWQGFGAVCCLQETNATVWTINLPFGESMAEGSSGYRNGLAPAAEIQAWAAKVGLAPSAKSYHTDRLGFIGRMYLEKELGNRVCQIYCDSQEWDVSNFPADFFDSALIDGGHSPEIVLADTRKALRVLRPGGLILWHDFFLDAEARQKNASVDKLVRVVDENLGWLQPQLSDLFWIEPSWLLVGRKAGSDGRFARYFRRLGNALFDRSAEVGSPGNGRRA